MFPNNIVQDAEGPIQLHRTRLNQTGTELSNLRQNGIRLTDLDSRSALTNRVVLCLFDNPHRDAIL